MTKQRNDKLAKQDIRFWKKQFRRRKTRDQIAEEIISKWGGKKKSTNI